MKDVKILSRIGFSFLFIWAGIALAAPSWVVKGDVATIDATTMHTDCEAGVQRVKVDFTTHKVKVYCYGDYELPPISASVNEIEITTRHWLVAK